MPSDNINAFLRTQLDDLKAKGLYKAERRIDSPQKSGITVNGREVVNFCANNYLGLANHPDIVNAAFEGLKTWGYGLSSVRFICGTQSVHKACEQQIAKFFRTRKPPVAAEETVELMAFMEAADESKRQGGKPVAIESVMEKARQEARKKL